MVDSKLFFVIYRKQDLVVEVPSSNKLRLKHRRRRQELLVEEMPTVKLWSVILLLRAVQLLPSSPQVPGVMNLVKDVDEPLCSGERLLREEYFQLLFSHLACILSSMFITYFFYHLKV